MPSKSKKQHRFMVIAAHDKAFAKRHNISQKVAREYVQADKRVGIETFHTPRSTTHYH